MVFQKKRNDDKVRGREAEKATKQTFLVVVFCPPPHFFFHVDNKSVKDLDQLEHCHSTFYLLTGTTVPISTVIICQHNQRC